jgi:hypothetical protein
MGGFGRKRKDRFRDGNRGKLPFASVASFPPIYPASSRSLRPAERRHGMGRI